MVSRRNRSSTGGDLRGGDDSDEGRLQSSTADAMENSAIPIFKMLHVHNHSRPHDRRSEPCMYYKPLKPAFHESCYFNGHQIRSLTCRGASSRSVAFLVVMMMAFASVKSHRFSQHTNEKHIRTMTERTVAFLKGCRPHNIATGNAIRWVKEAMIPGCLSHYPKPLWADLIARMSNEMIYYIRERYLSPQLSIARNLVRLLGHSERLDVCTFGYSTSVLTAILALHEKFRSTLRVFCINENSMDEGHQMAQTLVDYGMKNIQVLPIEAYFHVGAQIREEAILLLGAVTVTANGAVLSRAGTMTAAIVSKGLQIPIFVLCQTAKFSPRSVTDAYSHNELQDAKALLARWRQPSTIETAVRRRAEAMLSNSSNQDGHSWNSKKNPVSRYIIPTELSFKGKNGDKWRRFSQSQMKRDSQLFLESDLRSQGLREKKTHVIEGRYEPIATSRERGEKNPFQTFSSRMAMPINDRMLYLRVLSHMSTFRRAEGHSSSHDDIPLANRTPESMSSAQGIASPYLLPNDGQTNATMQSGTTEHSRSETTLTSLPRSVGRETHYDEPPNGSNMRRGRLPKQAHNLGVPGSPSGTGSRRRQSLSHSLVTVQGNTAEAAATPRALVPMYDLTEAGLIDTLVCEIGLMSTLDTVIVLRDYDGNVSQRA